MATPDAPSISHYVNDAGAYVLCISAVPDEHLHRPLIVHVGDDTVLDEFHPRRPGRARLVRLVRGGAVAHLPAP